MKPMKLLTICLSLNLLFFSKAFTQANTQLSNLVAPTQVNVNLLPKATNTKDLGSDTKRWRNLHMGGIMYRQGYLWMGGEYWSGNTFLGLSAGYTSLNSQSINQINTFVGENSGFNTTTGTANTFLGAHTGQYNTTGGSNTFVGVEAGRDNTTGQSNTFLGIAAGTRNTTGRNNIAIGEVAGGFNKTGYSNTWVGNEAGYLNSIGNRNTMVGDSSGRSATSDLNTMMGWRSGTNTTSGLGNTFLGAEAGINNTTGGHNTAVGYFTLDDNNTATGNTALGFSAGTVFTNGNFNTFIGYDADAGAAGLTNSTALGSGSTITASNQVRIGNSNVTSIGGYAGWTTLPSDGRVKKNIKANVPGLLFINKLKPLTYNLNLDAIDEIMQSKSARAADAGKTQPTQEELGARKQKEAVVYTGFIAQDVQKAAQELNYDFSGVDAAKNGKDMYGIRYAEFVVPLVQAVQELSKMNDEKDAIIKKQQEQLNQVLERLNKVEQQMNMPNVAGKSSAPAAITTASLKQNTPNPFNANTTISYNIPSNAKSAQIAISTAGGSILKTMPVYTKGAGQVTVAAGELSAGNYFYTLIVDGKKIASKEMTLTK